MAEKIKIASFRSLSKEELAEKSKTLKEELSKLNLQRFGGRVEKPHMFAKVKREIAWINTILNEKKDK